MATTKNTVLQAALDGAAAGRDADLGDLIEELRIPSVSTLPERREDCLRNAKWLRERFEKLGMKTEIIDVLEGGLPVVVAHLNRPPGPAAPDDLRALRRPAARPHGRVEVASLRT